MTKKAALPLLAAVVLACVGLFAARWEERHAPPLLGVELAVLLLAPVALRVLLSRRAAPAGGGLPHAIWFGLALMAAGFLGASTLFAVPQISTYRFHLTTQVGYSGPSPSPKLRFSALPPAASAAFRTAFPNLVVGRSLYSSTGAYEVWLRRPGHRTFALQAIWRQGEIQVQNQDLNTSYTGRQGTLPGRAVLQEHLQVPKGDLGPFDFPGYVVFVSLPKDQIWAVYRIFGPNDSIGALSERESPL